MNEGKVRVAIIGANFTLRAMIAMGYPKDLGELAAICDWNPEMLEKIRKDYGAEYPDVRLVRAFFEYVAHGVKPAVSPIAARNAVAVGALGHYSARHGNVPMNVPPVPDHILRYFGEA